MILTVESYDEAIKDDFVVPTSYVRFQSLPGDEVIASSSLQQAAAAAAAAASGSSTSLIPSSSASLSRVDLDLELAEMKWLRSHPKYGENGDPRYQLTLGRFAQMLDVLEKATAVINPNVLTLAEAEDVLARQLQMVKTPLNRATVDVYNYWAQKRQALKRPLLRKYWPQTPLNDTNPHLVFRPREKERYKLRKHRKNDMDGYRKMQQLRHDFDRVRHLLDLVKRRETAKRLSVDYLDEIRTQALYELTDRSGNVRKPNIPMDDERHKKRKKKKKKHRSDSEDAVGGFIGTANDAGALADSGAQQAGASTGAGAGAAPSTNTIVTPMSFMEYDTSSNFTMDLDGAPHRGGDVDDDWRVPFYPSYPVPASHFMANIFGQPPKYRCRGRIGRGGRLILDRRPVSVGRYYGPTEVSATTLHYPLATALDGTGAVSGTASVPATPAPSEAINSGHHTAVLVQEAAFRPTTTKLETVTTKRLDEIYNMSDSEDELLELRSASVLETTPGRKSSGTKAAQQALNALPARRIKFGLDL